MPRSSPPRPTLGLVLVRACTGAVLVVHGWNWIQTGRPTGTEVRSHVRAALDELPATAVWWANHVLLRNPDGAAFLWRWAAFVLGLLLVLGALTRPVGALAALFLAHGLLYGPPHQDVAFLLLLVGSLASAASGAGRRVGLDAVFDQHFPSWLTWRRRSSSIFP